MPFDEEIWRETLVEIDVDVDGDGKINK